jgi:hypothetical protein
MRLGAEAVSSDRPGVRGISGVLRVLAAGATLDELADRLATDPRMVRAGATDPATILGDAAELVREHLLLPPAQAAFVRDDPGSDAVLERLPTAATAALRDLLAGGAPTKTDERALALRYAAAVVDQQQILELLGEARASESSRHTMLSTPDRERVEAFLLYRSLNRPHQTLDSLTHTWEQLIEELEGDGAHHMYEEHVDWLTVRDSLETALSLLSPEGRSSIDPEINGLDARFLAATDAIGGSIDPPRSWEPQAWWWFRLPNRMGWRFRDYLEHALPHLLA